MAAKDGTWALIALAPHLGTDTVLIVPLEKGVVAGQLVALWRFSALFRARNGKVRNVHYEAIKSVQVSQNGADTHIPLPAERDAEERGDEPGR